MKRFSILLSLFIVPTMLGCAPVQPEEMQNEQPPVVQEEAPAPPLREEDLVTKNVTYTGILEQGGVTIYQEGSHRLTLSDGKMVLLKTLPGTAISLDLYAGKLVRANGDVKPTVEAGGTIMDVKEIHWIRREQDENGKETEVLRVLCGGGTRVVCPDGFACSLEEDGTGICVEGGAEEEGENEPSNLSFTESTVALNEVAILRASDIPNQIESENGIYGCGGIITNAILSPNGEYIAIAVHGAAHDCGWLFNVSKKTLNPIAFSYGGGVDVKEWSRDGRFVTLIITTAKPERSEVEIDTLSLPKYPHISSEVEDIEESSSSKSSASLVSSSSSSYPDSLSSSSSSSASSISNRHEQALMLMIEEDYAADRWTQEYCSSHVGFCVAVHKNWYFKSFGAMTSVLWHVEMGAENVDAMGDGPIFVELKSGSLEGLEVSDGDVKEVGNRVIGYRAWTESRHFEISAPKELREPVMFITQSLKSASGE